MIETAAAFQDDITVGAIVLTSGEHLFLDVQLGGSSPVEKVAPGRKCGYFFIVRFFSKFFNNFREYDSKVFESF